MSTRKLVTASLGGVALLVIVAVVLHHVVTALQDDWAAVTGLTDTPEARDVRHAMQHERETR